MSGSQKVAHVLYHLFKFKFILPANAVFYMEAVSRQFIYVYVSMRAGSYKYASMCEFQHEYFHVCWCIYSHEYEYASARVYSCTCLYLYACRPVCEFVPIGVNNIYTKA